MHACGPHNPHRRTHTAGTAELLSVCSLWPEADPAVHVMALYVAVSKGDGTTHCFSASCSEAVCTGDAQLLALLFAV